MNGCSGLKKVTLSNSLTEISGGTFKDCSGLTSIILPESVTTISRNSYLEGAFENCTNLEKILIPDSVATIGTDVFEGCDKLTIYGHDGKVSKQYAEENNIKFDYIENWDKNSGSDISSPVVDSMHITSGVSAYYNSETRDYRIPVGVKIIIEVKFNEPMKGTPPTLTLKIGDGKEKNLSNGVIVKNTNTIRYEYTTVKEDSGLITVSKFEGGEITDNSGNKAVLSTKELTAGSPLSYHYAYVDNTKYSNPSQDNSNTNNSGNSGGSQNLNNSSNKSNQNNGDPTTAKGILPQTGENVIIVVSIIGIIAIAVTIYLKIRKLRDI